MAPRYNNLTVARFAAALMVYMSHIQAPESAIITSEGVRHFVNNGFVGVSFFFIVSGFVLAASNLERFDVLSVHGVSSFYWKRLARIVPLWLLVSSPLIWKSACTDRHGLWEFITFTQAWDPDLSVAFGLLAVAWSLSVEMFFYLLFPFIAFVVNRMRRKTAATALLIGGLAIPTVGAAFFAFHPDLAHLPIVDIPSPHYWLYRFPPMRLGEFMAGIGACIAVSELKDRLTNAMWHVIGAASVASLFLTLVMAGLDGAWYVVPTVYVLVAIVIYLARIETSGFRVTSQPLILLGEASFALYLVHHFYFKKTLFLRLTETMDLHAAQLTTLGLAIASSVGLYLLVESPARDMLLRFGRVRSTMPVSVVEEVEWSENGDSNPLASQSTMQILAQLRPLRSRSAAQKAIQATPTKGQCDSLPRETSSTEPRVPVRQS
jgi:peptidoglycan/LPS O-acetylase OafA/YrhL